MHKRILVAIVFAYRHGAKNYWTLFASNPGLEISGLCSGREPESSGLKLEASPDGVKAARNSSMTAQLYEVKVTRENKQQFEAGKKKVTHVSCPVSMLAWHYTNVVRDSLHSLLLSPLLYVDSRRLVLGDWEYLYTCSVLYPWTV